jgi:hypothetical protein
MKVSAGVLIVKSSDVWYIAEREDGKHCTVRLVDQTEWYQIADADPEFIEVRCADYDSAFRRRITWMGQVGDMFGQLLVVICWAAP